MRQTSDIVNGKNILQTISKSKIILWVAHSHWKICSFFFRNNYLTCVWINIETCVICWWRDDDKGYLLNLKLVMSCTCWGCFDPCLHIFKVTAGQRLRMSLDYNTNFCITSIEGGWCIYIKADQNPFHLAVEAIDSRSWAKNCKQIEGSFMSPLKAAIHEDLKQGLCPISTGQRMDPKRELAEG